MAYLNETFNANELPEDTGSFDPIPAGEYTVAISEATLNDTKAGTGQYIKLRMDVTGPTHQGRVLFANINIRNPNPKAEEIGRQQLGSIMRAIGLTSLQDTDQLIGGQMAVKVTIRPGNEQYPDPQNEVKGFKAISGSPAPAPTPQASAAQQSAPAGGKVPPWMAGKS